MRTKPIIAGAAVVFLTALVLWWPVAVFTVRLPRQDERAVCAIRVTPGDEIRLSYRHSVERTAVEGRFVVDAGPDLLARETRMASVGTGLPNTAVARTRREPGWIVVDEEPASVNGFTFFLSAVNQTRLNVEDRAVNLAALPSGTVLRLSVERMGLGKWFYYATLGSKETHHI